MLELIVAAVAGFVSFISPCVLPLVPAYIGYMGGRMTNTVSTQVSGDGSAVVSSGPSLAMRLSTFMHGLAFVAGFTFVFVTLGLIGTAFVQQFGSTSTIEGLIGRIGGVVIIFLGLHFMGILPSFFNFLRQRQNIINNPLTSIAFLLLVAAVLIWGFTGTLSVWNSEAYATWALAIGLVLLAFLALWMFTADAFTQPGEFWNRMMNSLDRMLYADTRRQMNNPNKGLSSSAIMGVVFAAGWTPCIGPTLGVAFTLAANGGDVGQAAGLMAAYSLGLGIPFLLVALSLDGAQGFLTRLKRHMTTIKLVSGGLLVIIGIAIASGSLQSLSRQWSGQFADFSYRVENCVVGTVEGNITLSQTGTCLSGEEEYETLVSQNQAEDGESAEPNTAEDTPAVDTESASGITDLGESSEGGPEVGLSVGDLAPNFQTTDLAGETVSLTDYRGRVVLLNFWFTDCGPCRIEMPEFEEVYNRYQDELVIVAVNREESPETIQAFADELGLTFPILLDESGDIQFEYNIFGYPSTLVLDENGVIQHRAFSALTEEQIRDMVDDALS